MTVHLIVAAIAFVVFLIVHPAVALIWIGFGVAFVSCFIAIPSWIGGRR